MSKIIKNTTASDIVLSDTGVTILANSQITIPPVDYLLWAESSNVVTHVGSEDLVVNDGSYDLSISDGIDLIKGLYTKSVQLTDGNTSITFIDDNGTPRIPVDANVTAIVEPSEFYFSVIQGNVSGHTGHTTYGRVPELDINQIFDVTPFGDMTWLPSAETVKISSDNVNDTSAGTGLRTVVLYGLSATHTEQSETLILDGITEVTSANTYLRINYMRGATVGSSNKNQGTIVLQGTTTPGTLSQIEPEKGASEQLAFTVPAGKTCYITNLRASVTAAVGTGPKEGLLQFWVKPLNGPWTMPASEGLTSDGGPAWFNPMMPLVIPEKSDVKMVAQSRQNNSQITSITQYVMVENA